MAIVQSTIWQMSGAHALVAALDKQGIRHLFGVPGHGAYPIYDALNDYPSVAPVVGRNEQGSIFAADGYSRVSEDVAVATSVPLAGVTNALTSLWEINGHGSRVLYVVEYDPVHAELLHPVARYYRKVFSIADVAPAVHELIRQLRIGRPGLAVLEVPNGVLHSVDATDPSDGLEDRAIPLPSLTTLDAAAHLLSNAKRPAICAGGYGWDCRSGRSLTELAETLRAPVLTGNMSKGVIADDHPLCLGFNWNVDGRADRLLAEADAVLAIGPRAGMATGLRSNAVLAQQLIHVDWDGAEQGPDVPARLQLNGNLPAILETLAERVTPRQDQPWSDEVLAQIRSASAENANQTIPWALPFYAALRSALPRDGLLFTDSLVGLWAFRLFPAYAPNTVHFPWFTGTLGHGVPAAFGASLARPDLPIMVLAGDGAFLYNSQELAAMNHYRRKLVVVVANDNAYSAILFNMTARFGRSIAHGLSNPDFVKLGEAYGMDSIRLANLEEAEPALRAAIQGDRSVLIEAPLQLRPPRL